MQKVIVHSNAPVTLVGAYRLDRNDLNKSLTIAPTLIVADGGLSHLHKDDPQPIAIIGDFDSLPSDISANYSDRLHKMEDQNTTDFEKVISSTTAPCYLALGFWGGRMDHSFATLNVMAKYGDKKIVLFGESEVAIRLKREFSLTVPVGSPCALLPFGSARVWTRGLKWDLNGAVLSMAGNISTSNEVAEPKIEIRTDGPVMLTLPKPLVDAVLSAVLE